MLSFVKNNNMKSFLVVLAFSLFITQTTQAQVSCGVMSLTVNVSDTDFVKLYHPGHYLTFPGEYNVIAWEVTDDQGNIIAVDTLIDNSDFSLYHNIPISDVMFITAHLTNDSAIDPNGNPVSCLIVDQLQWNIEEVIPGTFIGGWGFTNDWSSVGVDQNNLSAIDNMVLDNKQLISIVDLLGRKSKEMKNKPLFYIYKDGKVEKRIIVK